MTESEEIKKEDVGSLEDVLGEEDSLFAPDTVDLTDSQEENVTTEDFGKGEAEGENTVTENMKDNAPDEVEEKPAKIGCEETVIEYLFNPNNKKIFPVNDDIVKQKFLVPCTKDGKLLPDTRRPSDFR